MKQLFIIVILIVTACVNSKSQSIYPVALKNIDGDSILLNTYAGKKIMFIIAPLSQQDSTFQQLVAFKNRYGDTIKIIGIPSIEDGYSASGAAALKSLYASTAILLAEGMHTRKAAGSNQSLIMQWLTDHTKNRYFNMDAEGVGHKFFINETGRLFGVLPRQAPLHAPIIDRIVHSVPR